MTLYKGTQKICPIVTVEPTLTTKNITQNGTYNASSDNADGYSSVTVNVAGGGGGKYPTGNYFVMNDDSIQSLYFEACQIGGFSLSCIYLTTNFTTMDGTESGAIYSSPARTPADYHSQSLSKIQDIQYVPGDSSIDITQIKHINLSGITGLVAMSGANRVFQNFTSLKSIDLSRATSCQLTSGFVGASTLESVDLSSLSDLSTSLALGGSVAIGGAFAYTAVKTLSFPSLNTNSFGTRTNQFNQMLKGVTGCTVHFPSNLQSVIGSWSSVKSGFGGTNTTVLFDLPATT